MKKLIDRFLRYIQIDTASDRDSHTVPSTPGQLILERLLLAELEEMGVQAQMSESGVVYGHLSANCAEKGIPAIGFVSHVDTPQDLNCKDIKPRFVHNYDGGILVLNSEHDRILDPYKYPFLKNLVGHDLITTDGSTILGADDKAGVAELMTLMSVLSSSPEIKHGDVYVAFTVDEEIGKGIEYFDFQYFPCDFAYTVDIDGNDIHCLDYETVCSGWAEISVYGKPMHPGTGTGVIQNANLLAMELNSLLPLQLDPFFSKEYEGYNHLVNFCGKPDYAHMVYRTASFDEYDLWKQMYSFQEIAEQLNQKYGYQAFNVQLEQSACNMRKYIEKDMRSIEFAKKAMKSLGLNPVHRPIRGGTDGVQLSQKGIPTPNLNNGSYNALSYDELVSTNYMQRCVDLLLKIVEVRETF